MKKERSYGKELRELKDRVDQLEARVLFLENLVELPDPDLPIKAREIISLIDEIVLRKINPRNHRLAFSKACHAIARLSASDYIKLKKEYGLRHTPAELEKALVGAFALYAVDPPKTLVLALANLYRIRTSGYS